MNMLLLGIGIGMLIAPKKVYDTMNEDKAKRVIKKTCDILVLMNKENKNTIDKLVKTHYDITSMLCNHIIEGVDSVLKNEGGEKLRLAYEESKLYLSTTEQQTETKEN